MNFFFSLVLSVFCFSCVAMGHLNLFSSPVGLWDGLIKSIFSDDEDKNKAPANKRGDYYYNNRSSFGGYGRPNPNGYNSQGYNSQRYAVKENGVEVKKPLPHIQKPSTSNSQYSSYGPSKDQPSPTNINPARESDFMRKVESKLQGIRDEKAFNQNVNYYFQKAARQGYVKAIDWLLRQARGLSIETVRAAFAGAAYYGHNHVVVWMLEKNITPDTEAVNRAFVSSVNAGGKVMRLLMGYDFRPDQNGADETFTMAAFKDSLEIMKLMLEKRLYPSQGAVNSAYFAASNKNPNMLRWLMESRFYPDSQETSNMIFLNAVATNNTETALILLDLPKNAPNSSVVNGSTSFFESDNLGW